MKNFLSLKLFGKSYSELPLASEIIVDIQQRILIYKIFSFLCAAAIVATLIAACVVR